MYIIPLQKPRQLIIPPNCMLHPVFRRGHEVYAVAWRFRRHEEIRILRRDHAQRPTTSETGWWASSCFSPEKTNTCFWKEINKNNVFVFLFLFCCCCFVRVGVKKNKSNLFICMYSKNHIHVYNHHPPKVCFEVDSQTKKFTKPGLGVQCMYCI